MASVDDAQRAHLAARAIVTSLEERSSKAAADLRASIEAKRNIALAALTGNEDAKRELDRLGVVYRKGEDDHQDLLLALDEARSRVVHTEQALADAVADEQVAQARELGSKLVEVSARFDAAIGEAVAALGDRETLRQQLKATRALSDDVLNRLLRAETINRAMAFAGLDTFAEFPRTAVSTKASLVDADSTAVSQIRRPPAGQSR